MASPVTRGAKPRFRAAETWGACSRCGARVPYSTLRRERLTGLLMCSETSGRPVAFCWDPWPEVFDFQVKPDRSIEPPPEALPARWNLDAIWGNGPDSGTTKDFANAPTPAPDDATRLQQLIRSVPYYRLQGQTAAFDFTVPTVKQQVDALNYVNPADYDGTFLPSSSVRLQQPPSPSSTVSQSDRDDIAAKLWGPPATTAKGV